MACRQTLPLRKLWTATPEVGIDVIKSTFNPRYEFQTQS